MKKIKTYIFVITLIAFNITNASNEIIIDYDPIYIVNLRLKKEIYRLDSINHKLNNELNVQKYLRQEDHQWDGLFNEIGTMLILILFVLLFAHFLLYKSTRKNKREMERIRKEIDKT